MAHVLPAKKAKSGGEKLQNIKVMVRVRPLDRTEEEHNVKSIVKCNTHRELQIKDKRFNFDRIFRSHSSQLDIYKGVVAPMIPDVISGYNCTVFAYGQTGSGKTYTMTGDKCKFVEDWKTDPEAGCIPRAAAHIFEELQLEKHERSVKVSYLELYNEEIRDLLNDEDIVLPIFNDNKGCVFIQGLTEVSVHDSQGLCRQLQKGTLRRQTAPTLMNHQSSRSHTVFTITVHTRESTISGEDILKTGKINLVDLAGSENVARSGCKDVRAVELANINKSLLTLGRVIQALADKSLKHVPYRDSKLTRILQDSLGGHTKTAIIATISPTAFSLEETMSTLEYASRARDIKNAPQVNEKMTRTQVIQGLMNDIERLQKDLEAARDKSGFYVDKTNYEELIAQIDAVTGEKLGYEDITRKQTKRISQLEQILKTKKRQFDDAIDKCKRHKELLIQAKEVGRRIKKDLNQEQYISQVYEAQASEFYQQAEHLLETSKQLTRERDVLRKKLAEQRDINVTNEGLARDAVCKFLDLLNKACTDEKGIAKKSISYQ
ncbi:hypothetical protein NQ317_006148 [Molorchus minor]|uniref:Kinesin-like protein n=1 Tax=Molorchus minor TaxID=1323400 RepID=A0ABQ9K4E6_9CUCU|nr:hypothetical protein NQ317_006148 [Molorchus minor]